MGTLKEPKDWREKVEYAVEQTKVLLYPRQKLETFSSTTIRYYVLSELLDSVNQVRLRQGLVTAERPKIITPTYLRNVALEGFTEDARDFLNWLNQYADGYRFMEYGYHIQQASLSQQVLSGDIRTVAGNIERKVQDAQDSLAGIVIGVDNLWEISLIKFITDVTRGSIQKQVRDLSEHRLFDLESGVPRYVRQEIEAAIQQAEENPSTLRELGSLLQRHGLFEEYQDRFFEVIRRSRR